MVFFFLPMCLPVSFLLLSCSLYLFLVANTLDGYLFVAWWYRFSSSECHSFLFPIPCCSWLSPWCVDTVNSLLRPIVLLSRLTRTAIRTTTTITTTTTTDKENLDDDDHNELTCVTRFAQYNSRFPSSSPLLEKFWLTPIIFCLFPIENDWYYSIYDDKMLNEKSNSMAEQVISSLNRKAKIKDG